MRRIAITLAASAGLMFGSALTWQAQAQMERGPAALAGAAQNFTPIEKAACGPHWGRWCGPVPPPGLRPISLLVRALLAVIRVPRSDTQSL